MRIRCFFLIIVLLGCRQEPVPARAVGIPDLNEIAVPADVPEQLVLREKDGTRRIVNGKIMYATAYRHGWKEYLDRHERGEIRVDDREAKPDLLVADYGIEQRAMLDGFSACRLAILSKIESEKWGIQEKGENKGDAGR